MFFFSIKKIWVYLKVYFLSKVCNVQYVLCQCKILLIIYKKGGQKTRHPTGARRRFNATECFLMLQAAPLLDILRMSNWLFPLASFARRTFSFSFPPTVASNRREPPVCHRLTLSHLSFADALEALSLCLALLRPHQSRYTLAREVFIIWCAWDAAAASLFHLLPQPIAQAKS